MESFISVTLLSSLIFANSWLCLLSSIILNSILFKLNLKFLTCAKILSKYLETIQSLKNRVGTPKIK